MAHTDTRVAARFFDGVPFTINIPSLTAVANGGTADILIGNMVHKNESWVVAVKVFKTVLSNAEKMLLLRELEIARQVARRHPFIAPFIGTADIGRETSIVSLYMENGNLLDYLKANKDADRKKLILQVAEAVQFLHSDEGLVHGDLKCANVLISDFGNALLADFGLSTFVEKAQSSATTATDVRTMYTARFAAPELLLDSAGDPSRPRSKTCETDVYAFGMLVLEAITEKSPWFGLREFAVMNRVLNRQVPQQPLEDGVFVSISHAWWDICRECWTYEPSSRPTMQTVLDNLSLHSPLPVRIFKSPDDDRYIFDGVYMPCGERVALGYFNWLDWESDEDEAVMTVWIYDTSSGQSVVGPLTGPADEAVPPSLLALCPDGRIISASGPFITRWDTTSGAQIGYTVSCEDVTEALDFSPDTNCVAYACEDEEKILLWDTITGKPLGDPLVGHTARVMCAAFSPSATHIVSGCSHGALFLWHILTGKLLATATATDGVSCVCFSPSGERIVSGSWNGQIDIWDARTLKLERTLQQVSDMHSVSSVAHSPSGKYLSASAYGSVRIWDTESWKPVGMPRSCEDFTRRMKFSPNGKSLLACTEEAVHIFDIVE